VICGALLAIGHAGRAQQPLADTSRGVSGVVLAADGRPVGQADVVLLGLGAARTDSLGQFGFRGVPAGTLLVRVQRIGFVPIMQSIAFDGVHSLRVTLRFGETTAMLAPVVVRDSANPGQEPSGFERRRLTGHGLYLTEGDISNRRAQRVEHLLAMLPGLEVDTSGVVRTDRGRTSLFGDNCKEGVQLFVDGVPVSGSYSLRNMSPGAIRGIEVYRGVASTPVELRSARVACGTVVIWTK
jgi:hypothetical protein